MSRLVCVLTSRRSTGAVCCVRCLWGSCCSADAETLSPERAASAETGARARTSAAAPPAPDASPPHTASPEPAPPSASGLRRGDSRAGLLWQDNIWPRYNYLKIWNLRVQKHQNIEKIAFKVVQMKFLAMHITNQKLSFDIFTVGNLQNIFMEHDLNILMIFGIKEKFIILTHTVYCWLLLQI